MAVTQYKKSDLLLLTPYEGLSILHKAMYERDVNGVFDSFSNYFGQAYVSGARVNSLRSYTQVIDRICSQYLNPYDEGPTYLSLDFITKYILEEELVNPSNVITGNAFVYSVDWLCQSLRILSQLKYADSSNRKSDITSEDILDVVESVDNYGTSKHRPHESLQAAINDAVSDLSPERTVGYFYPSIQCYSYYFEGSLYIPASYDSTIRVYGTSVSVAVNEMFYKQGQSVLMSGLVDTDSNFFFGLEAFGNRVGSRYNKFYKIENKYDTIPFTPFPLEYPTTVGDYQLLLYPVSIGLDISHTFTVFAE